MATKSRSAILSFLPATIAILIAVATGVAWLGRPLRLVQLVTMIGLSMTAGATLARAVWRLRQDRATGSRRL